MAGQTPNGKSTKTLGFRSDQFSALAALIRHGRASREQLEAFRDARIRRLISHAYQNVPYCKALMDSAGVRPRDIHGAADLPAIPITSKDAMRSVPASDLLARGLKPERLITHQTSGSSGQPLTLRRTWSEERLLNAFRDRALTAYGVHLGHRRTLLQGPHLSTDDPKRFLRAIGLVHDQLLDCLRPAVELLREMHAFRPDVILGYPGVLARIATVMAQEGAAPVRPRLIITGGEVLSESVRRRIQDAFAAPVFDRYGAYEFNLLAWECPKRGAYHLCEDSTVVEVVRNGQAARNGEWGEVIATNLYAFAMPFIRYRLGDLVLAGPSSCACGAPFSTISAIEGRVWDFFPLRDGRVLHPLEFVRVCESTPWIRDYQFLQERENLILARLAPWSSPSASQVEDIAAQFRAILQDACDFQVQIVSEIPLDASGKLRHCRSLVWSKDDVWGSGQHMVGPRGLEPRTSPLSGVRSHHLS